MPHSFTDRYGNVHVVDLTAHTVERLRSELGLNVYDLASVSKVEDDFPKALKLLWIVTGEQGEFNDFARCQTMQTIQDGAEAFVDELCELLPSAQASVLRASREKLKEFQNAIYAKAEALITSATVPA